MKIVSWNIAGSREPWRRLLDMDADIALLQEAGNPPEVAACIDVNPGPWRTAPSGWHLPWRTAVVRLSKRVQVEWIETKAIEDAASGELAVSHPGTLAAATVTPPDGEPIVVVSMYAPWRRPYTSSSWIVSDASVHRIVSDLSLLIGRQQGHRIIAAGDLNILHGYGDYGSAYWAARYQTVFTRMEALGLPFVGPQAPHGGRQADPWPKELPRESLNVPTHYSDAPATATRQLDFVFASQALADSLCVRALNEPDQWGPSDHCRLEIEVL